MAPKRTRQSPANKKVADDKPVKTAGEEGEGVVALGRGKSRQRRSQKQEKPSSPTPGSKRGRRELEGANDDESKESGKASGSGDKGKVSSKRVATSKEPSDRSKKAPANKTPDSLHGIVKAETPTDATAASGKSDNSALPVASPSADYKGAPAALSPV